MVHDLWNKYMVYDKMVTSLLPGTRKIDLYIRNHNNILKIRFYIFRKDSSFIQKWFDRSFCKAISTNQSPYHQGNFFPFQLNFPEIKCREKNIAKYDTCGISSIRSHAITKDSY